MRRLLALMVLAVFMSVPALQLRCAFACAYEDAAKSSDSCPHDAQRHASTVGVTTIATHHDCDQHATPAVIAATDRPLKLDGLPLLAVESIPTVKVVAAIAAGALAAPIGGPPGTFLVPLRL